MEMHGLCVHNIVACIVAGPNYTHFYVTILAPSGKSIIFKVFTLTN